MRPICLLAPLMLLSLSTGARAQHVSTERLFRQAQAASRENNYAQAEKLYRQVLAAEPGILPARVNLGLACYWQHKTREAAHELGEALRVSPREFSALLFTGLAYIELGQYEGAQKVLLKAARVNDMDPLLFWALGSLAIFHGEANAAVPLLERCVALDPENVRCVALLGQAYAILAYRKEERALVPADYAALVDKSLRWVEERQPNSALLHVFKGDVLGARKLTSEALVEYRQALEIDPHWPDIHLLMGSLLGLLGRWDEALAELKFQLRDYPDDIRAWIEMGSVYCRAGNYVAALPILERAVGRDSTGYEGNYRLGQAYVSLGKYALAVSYLESAVRFNPEKTEPYYLLFRAYQGLKEPEKAARALEQFNRQKAIGPPVS